MKKIISIILAVMLVASLVATVSAYSVFPDGVTSDEAIAAYCEAMEIEPGEVETHKYLFQMPNGKNGPVAQNDVTYSEVDEETGEETVVTVCKAGEHAPSWYHEGFNEGAGVYWWEGAAACDSWAGYKALVEDEAQCIYYANVPVEVVMFIWNNGIDGGSTPTAGVDPAEDIYYKAAQTADLLSEYPDPDEYASIPEGADSFDNMIAVVDPDQVSTNALSKKMTCGINWYFYYGDGCYGSYAEDSENFSSIEENCLNPQHYVDGVHVGYQPEVEPVTVMKGDLNDDKQVNNRDAIIMDRFVAGWDGYESKIVDMKAADLNNDEQVNNRDAMIMDRYVAGWEGYAKYFA